MEQQSSGSMVAGETQPDGDPMPVAVGEGTRRGGSAEMMAAEIESLRRQVVHLQRELVEIRSAMQASQTSHLGRTLLIYVLDVMCALFRPQRGQAMVLDVAGGTLKDSSDQPGAVGPLQMALERPSLQRAMRGQVSRVMTHYESAMWLPIAHGSAVAVIICLRRAATDPFSLHDEQLGAVLGPLVISALQTNHRTYDLHDDHEALRNLDACLSVCVRVAGGRVTALANDCDRLAHLLGLGRSERSVVRLGAILHDIGTVDLAEDLLHKQGSLSAEEISQIREHTVFGSAILRQVPEMDEVIPLVLHHHERWDGAGYPSSLAADAIPLGARIIAVVDAFYAMTSPRSYRPARSVDAALSDLVRCAGEQFDPAVVHEFSQLIRQAP